MKNGQSIRTAGSVLAFIGLAVVPVCAAPRPAAVAGFDSYVSAVEARLERQHQFQDGFLVLGEDIESRVRRGELAIERLNPRVEVPGAMLHHWRGSGFVAGASAADFRRLMKDIEHYPQRYQPQVLGARLLTQREPGGGNATREAAPNGDHLRAVLRVRQHHVLTVVMDTTYDITWGELDPRHGFSLSRSTQMVEIDRAGTAHERALGSDEEHGFLWRLNSYWSYAERDGGLEIQIESVSLTRDIPPGLGWMIRPFVQSIPRESLEFTLRATRDALRK